MTSILLGLGAALAWGTSDFLGGRFTTRLPVFTVGFAAHVSAVVLLTAALLVSGAAVSGSALSWGLAAGLATSFGGLALSEALLLALAAGKSRHEQRAHESKQREPTDHSSLLHSERRPTENLPIWRPDPSRDPRYTDSHP